MGTATHKRAGDPLSHVSTPASMRAASISSLASSRPIQRHVTRRARDVSTLTSAFAVALPATMTSPRLFATNADPPDPRTVDLVEPPDLPDEVRCHRAALRINGRNVAMITSATPNVQTMVAPVGKSRMNERYTPTADTTVPIVHPIARRVPMRSE